MTEPDKLSDYLYGLNKAKNTLEKLINVEREDKIDFSEYEIFNTNPYEGFNINNIQTTLLNGQFQPQADLVIFVREKAGTECVEKNKILAKKTWKTNYWVHCYRP